MAAILTFFQIVPNQEIMPAFINSLDSFYDLTFSFERVFSYYDVAGLDLRGSVNKHDFTVF